MLNQQLIDNLHEMKVEDQEAGRISDEKYYQVVEKNTPLLKQIIKEYGWPNIDLVGERGVNDAWLIVQHSDHDLPFQKEVLELLRDSVNKGKSPKVFLAYLEDRVLVNEGKLQRYGTQVTNDGVTITVKPVEDEQNLEQRRKEYDLPPMKIYLKSFEQFKKK